MVNLLATISPVFNILQLNPKVIIGFGVTLLALVICLNKSKHASKSLTVISSFLFLYYLLFTISNVFGLPDLKELNRLYLLDQALFNPNLELQLLADGLSYSFILNIVAFAPLGFLVPMISPNYRVWYKTVGFGFLFSLLIEVSQLFTLYRATDINDLIANTLGTLIGYSCFKIFNLIFLKNHKKMTGAQDPTRYLPTIILAIAYLNLFLIF